MRLQASLAVFLVAVCVGCGGDDTDDVEGADAASDARSIQVRWPASYAEELAAGVEIVVTPASGPPVTLVTDAEGRASVSLSGAATVEATIDLSEARVEALTGHQGAIELTARGSLATGDTTLALVLDGPVLGGFLIEEVSYTGAAGLEEGDHYFDDQFVEVYNNSTHLLYADGLLLADVHGSAGAINPGQPVTPFAADLEHVYVNSIWRIPGSGSDVPVPPGGSIVIAHDGTNHQPQSTVDMTDADFEAYNMRADNRDVDYPTVANLERVRFEGGFDWLLPVFGPGVVLLRGDNVETLPTADTGFSDATKVPLSWVVDAFEALMDGDSVTYKRVPAALDRGFVFSSGTYVGESAIRRVRTRIGERAVLQDSNDSTMDFEVVTAPQPREER